MVKKIRMLLGVFFVSFLISCFWFAPSSFGEQLLPKPGEVIDHNNYKNYAHLFSAGFLQAFEDGFGGLMKPMSIKVVETKPAPMAKAFLQASEKNRGKYSVDKDGKITGGYDFVGLPFPDLSKDDKDFVVKLMWNYHYRYLYDSTTQRYFGFSKRRGESTTYLEATYDYLAFANRMFDLPKPDLDNPAGLYRAGIIRYIAPISLKDTMILTYQYEDVKKNDEMFLYLPTMRRVLRGEAGQRSTPLQGSIQSLDDYYMFDGRIVEFNYELVGEQKVLGVADTTCVMAEAKKQVAEGNDIPYPKDNWELRDVYVISIVAKDPKYPYSKRIIYMDKENFSNYYADAYDRAGKLWKVWNTAYGKVPQPGGETICGVLIDAWGADIQFGMLTGGPGDVKINGQKTTYSDYMPGSLLKLAK